MSDLPEKAVQAARSAVKRGIAEVYHSGGVERIEFEAAPFVTWLAEIRADERRKVAEEIAEAITRSVCDPPRACANRACTDCARYMQAQEDAIIARRIGEACDAR